MQRNSLSRHASPFFSSLLGSFGGPGKESGELMHPQGMTIDSRSGTPLLLVCDTDNQRLQQFDLNGHFLAVVATGFRKPVAAAVSSHHVAVAELDGRVTILDQKNQAVSEVGENPERGQWSNFSLAPANWQRGVLAAPHGIAWDSHGNLYVQEWNLTGRVEKLARVH